MNSIALQGQKSIQEVNTRTERTKKKSHKPDKGRKKSTIQRGNVKREKKNRPEEGAGS